MQSENMKKAQPKLQKLEEKYKGKTDQESMMQKSQEMMLIYKENNKWEKEYNKRFRKRFEWKWNYIKRKRK